MLHIYYTIYMFQKIPDTGFDYGGVLTKKQPVVNPRKYNNTWH